MDRTTDVEKKILKMLDNAGLLMLGTSFAFGLVQNNPEQAVNFYRKDAELGFSDAQSALGCALLKGEGVNQNPEEAAKWLRKSAEQGNFNAQFMLWFLLNASDKGNIDEGAKIIEWLERCTVD